MSTDPDDSLTQEQRDQIDRDATDMADWVVAMEKEMTRD